MNDIVPLFFFSYSRGDDRDNGYRRNRYLKKFVNDLREQVSDLVDIDAEHVGFRDADNIKNGDDWKTEISINARRCHSLVCLYSIKYFDKNRQHEYCAKEFAVFLKRNKAKYHVDEIGGQFREAHYIFPVLWIGAPDLQAARLPPYAVASIQYTSKNAEYKENGLQWLMKKDRSAYYDILLNLARRIRDSANTPLPALETEIDIEQMYNAFWESPEGEAAAEPTAKSADVAALPAGPMQLLALEIRISSTDVPIWTPYKNSQNAPNFAALVSDVALSPENKFDSTIQTIDPTIEGFADDVSNVLAVATAKQIIPILFVHPDCLSNETARAAIKEVLKKKWRGGLVIPVDEFDVEAVALVAKYRSELEAARNDQEPSVMRIAVGDASKFQTAAASVAQAVLALIQKNGVVQQVHPQKDGLDTLPLFANTLGGAGNG